MRLAVRSHTRGQALCLGLQDLAMGSWARVLGPQHTAPGPGRLCRCPGHHDSLGEQGCTLPCASVSPSLNGYGGVPAAYLTELS